VKQVFPQIKADSTITQYLNYYEDDEVLSPRKFFFNILDNLEPFYLERLIKHANRERNRTDAEETKQEATQIRKEVLEKLNQELQLASKTVVPNTI
jgi:hypothetical protein